MSFLPCTNVGVVTVNPNNWKLAVALNYLLHKIILSISKLGYLITFSMKEENQDTRLSVYLLTRSVPQV